MSGDLRETIQNILSGLKNKEDDLFAICSSSFEKFLNKRELAFIQIECINKGVVWTKVKSPLVLFTLKFKKHGIIKEIRKVTEEIKDIKFYIGA